MCLESRSITTNAAHIFVPFSSIAAVVVVVVVVMEIVIGGERLQQQQMISTDNSICSLPPPPPMNELADERTSTPSVVIPDRNGCARLDAGIPLSFSLFIVITTTLPQSRLFHIADCPLSSLPFDLIPIVPSSSLSFSFMISFLSLIIIVLFSLHRVLLLHSR